tara:strand:+ start:784 stop:1110 length:327 start_codon:yes stop_codon:yes gene_type:complete
MKKKVYDVATGQTEILDWTAEEIASHHIGYASIAEKNTAYKLEKIKNLRLQKLQETDFWVMRGNMTDVQTTYRQKLRDIPADYDSSKYDELLNRDTDGNLTHSVWSKP